MAVGDQNDFVGRIRGALPKRWFPTSRDTGPSATPILDGVLNGLAVVWAWIYGLYADCYTQGRVATAMLVNLDLIALDFFGARIQRGVAQSDASFRLTVQQELLRPRATRPAMVLALTQLTGRAPRIFEPANTSDTGGWDIGGIGYDTGGGWGDTDLPFQCFLTAYRPQAQVVGGLANVGGWYGAAPNNVGAGGWDQGAMEWTDASQITGLVTDAMIQQCVVNNQLLGSVVWMNISN